MSEMVRELTGTTLEIAPIRSLCHTSSTATCPHPAAVVIPYQVSFMTFFELYRMNIPLFVPSPELLARWHVDYQALKGKSMGSRRGETQGWRAVLSTNTYRDFFLLTQTRADMEHEHDPNNERSIEAVRA